MVKLALLFFLIAPNFVHAAATYRPAAAVNSSSTIDLCQIFPELKNRDWYEALHSDNHRLAFEIAALRNQIFAETERLSIQGSLDRDALTDLVSSWSQVQEFLLHGTANGVPKQCR